jgi:hypothetical protein
VQRARVKAGKSRQIIRKEGEPAQGEVRGQDRIWRLSLLPCRNGRQRR